MASPNGWCPPEADERAIPDSAYAVELRVNGVVKQTLRRAHPKSSQDIMTLTGRKRLILKEGDKITVTVTPSQGREYLVMSGSSLAAESVRQVH